MSSESWYQIETLFSFYKNIILLTRCLGLNLEYTFKYNDLHLNISIIYLDNVKTRDYID